MRKKYIGIDILKFVLAIIIMCHHFQQVFGVRFSIINFYGGRLYWGYVTDFFFIISGFLMRNSVGLNIKNNSFKDYMKKRINRIYPMAMLSILVMWSFEWLYYIKIGTIRDEGVSIGLWTFLNSVILNFRGGAVELRGINNPLWYLCVLMICYVLFYFGDWLCNKLKISQIFFILIMIILGLSIQTSQVNIPFANQFVSRGYCGFFWGIILYEVCFLWSNRKKLMIGLIGLSIVLTLIYIGRATMFDNEWGIMVFIIYPLILMIAIGIGNYSSAFCCLLGAASYEIYLWHSVLMTLSKTILLTKYPEHVVGLTDMIVFCVIVCLFSIFMNIFVEKRAEHAFNQIIERLR